MPSIRSGSSLRRCWRNMFSQRDKPRFATVGQSVRQRPKFFVSLGRWRMEMDKSESVEWKTREVSATRALKRKLGERAARYKDEQAKWKQDYPSREPGH